MNVLSILLGVVLSAVTAAGTAFFLGIDWLLALDW